MSGEVATLGFFYLFFRKSTFSLTKLHLNGSGSVTPHFKRFFSENVYNLYKYMLNLRKQVTEVQWVS